MNRAPLIFLTALAAFALSFAAFVLAPQIQVGRQSLTTVTGGGAEYPKARPGQAAQGAAVYRANGCAACHSQQSARAACGLTSRSRKPGRIRRRSSRR